MSTDLTEAAWDRIDGWLRTHAPLTFATLAGPADEEEIRAAERELGVTFPPDLVASLRRHDGSRRGPAAFRFRTHDRLLGVREIVRETLAMRGHARDVPEEDAEFYWLPEYLKFGSYEVTSDGLTLDSRAGRASCGAVGRFFDETGTDFGHADSLGGYLTELARQLADGDAVAFGGRLVWESVRLPARPEWGDPGDPLPASDDGLPDLKDPGSPDDGITAFRLHPLQELGALIATLPRARVAEAARRQLRRLATESGLAKYPEIAAALDTLDAGEPVPKGGPLTLRLRHAVAQANARHDSLRAWTAERVGYGLWGSPYTALCEFSVLRGQAGRGWRAELLEDLGNPPVPAVPDDAFWAALDNPAVDTGGYRTRS
ncbi:SMI1/KNR4 family protein [Streptomyces sp. NPDC004539]|uniref:SMI1/KNR4 family protein n=1 Tax=Streptomyces sp. NPDC004539 TaxID=3154280 RepID=UPI0033A6B397